MRSTIFTLAAMLSLATTTLAQTEVSGLVSGVWTKENSPYIVIDNVTVWQGDTLAIEPGVEVRFNNSKGMEILGTLTAVGTATDSIYFRKNGNENWRRLLFNGRKSELRFVHIDGASTALHCYAWVTIRDSRITNCSAYGYDVVGANTLTIIRSVLENIRRNRATSGKVIIANSLIQNNSSQSGPIFESSYRSATMISNCIIQRNNGRDIFSTSNAGQVDIINSVLYDNTVSQQSLITGTVVNSILRGSNLIDGASQMKMAYSNIEGGFAGLGNIDADPLFADAANGDFALLPGSPCLDSGNPSVFYNDDNGSRNDMGVDGGSGLVPIPPNLQLDFGPAAAGDKLDFTIYNFRNAPFLLNQVVLSDSQNFTSNFSSPVSIRPDTNLTISIEYKAVTTGKFDETVSFSSPDFAGGDNPTVSLVGFSGTSGNVSGTWTKANSPYLITGDLRVPRGQSLTIEPGVEVRFAGHFLFRIEGQLDAIGAEGDTIVFTRNQPDTTWQGLSFQRAQPSILKHAKIEYVDKRPTDYGRAIGTNESDLIIRNSLITNNRIAICVFSDSKIQIIDTDIIANEPSSSAISCHGTNLTLVGTRIADNVASSGSNGTLYGYHSMILMNRCSIFDNLASTANIAFLTATKMSAINCTFSGNKSRYGDTGIYLGSSPNVEINNCIIRGASKIQKENAADPDPTFTYTNIEGGFDGEGNIDADPLFVDPENGNFALQPGSPSIDAGHPGAFFNDWDGSRNDMGATGGSGLVVTPTAIDFGPTGKGQNKSASLYISNFRAADFELNAATLSDNMNFSVSANLPLRIAPLARDSVVVNINPQVTAQINEELTLTSPDFAGSESATIPLSALAGIWQGPVSGSWGIDDSPVIVGGDLLVENGKSLIISPGVEILVDTTIAGTSAKFIVEGSLLAEGTEASPIVFGSIPSQAAPGVWGGLVLRSRGSGTLLATPPESGSKNVATDSSVHSRTNEMIPANETSGNQPQIAGTARLAYCQIKYAVTGITAEGDQVHIENCIIAQNSQDGIKWDGTHRIAAGQITGSTIENNGGWGIHCYAFAARQYGETSPTLSGNRIQQNAAGGIYLNARGGSAGTWYGTSDVARTSPTISENIITNNQGPAIEGFAEGRWTNGTPRDHWSYAYVEPKLSGNIIASNQGGILTKSPYTDPDGYRLSYSTITIDHTTMWGNANNSLFAGDSAEISLKNTIVWNAASPVTDTDNGGKIIATYSDIEGGYTGIGNINADPRFVDPFNGDFSLQSTSPAIDAGDPASPFEIDGTRADMGAIPFLQPPSPPTLVQPLNNDIVKATFVVLRWRPSSRADSYNVEVSSKPDFASLLAHAVNLADTTFALSKLVHDSSYYWRLQANNSIGSSVYSEVWRFTIGIDPPATPVLSEPAHNATDISISPALAWHPVPGADAYHLQMATSADFAVLLVDTSGVADTSFAAASLDHDASYFWRVAATNAGGSSDWSEAWRFTTIIETPAAPALIAPSDSATGVPVDPVLTWAATPRAASYQLQVAQSSDFVQTILDTTVSDTSAIRLSNLKNHQSYYWRVRAENAGGVSPWSPMWRFTTILARPATPVLSEPAHNATDISISPTLAWRPVPGADAYHLQMATSAEFATLLVDTSGVADTSFAAASLDHDASYFWRVAATNAGGSSEWSEAWRFTTIIEAPAAPALIAPSDSATGVPLDPVLTWAATPRAASYRLQVAQSSDFVQTILDTTVSDTLAIRLSNLQNNQSYYWRVRAENAGGVSPWSPMWRFTTILARPATPVLSEPAHNATDISISPALAWHPVPGADAYHLQMATNAEFATLLMDTSGVADTSVAAASLDHDASYFWRVAATNAGGSSDWSEAWRFTTIVEAPAAPALIAPSDSATGVAIDPVLTWAATPRAASYRLQVAQGSDFVQTILDTTVSDTLAIRLSNLKNNQSYYWRVRAENAGGVSPWSPMWRFTTIMARPAAPVLSEPAHNAADISTSPALAWHPVPGADAYHLQMATSADFAVLLVDTSGVADTSFAAASLDHDASYFWRVAATNAGGSSEWSEVWRFSTSPTTAIDFPSADIPNDFSLSQNYPNPFNPETSIRYGLPEPAHVVILVFSATGRLIRTLVDEHQGAGWFVKIWDGKDQFGNRVASGIYLIRMQAGSFRQMKKLTLLK